MECLTRACILETCLIPVQPRNLPIILVRIYQYMYNNNQQCILDGKQFAEFCGADMSNDTMVAIYTDVIADANLSTFQGIVLIMPSVILVFISFLCKLWFTIRAMY